MPDATSPESQVPGPKRKPRGTRDSGLETGASVRWQVVTESPEETRALGARLGSAAQPGDVFLLEGDFGSGKTVLVQGIAEGLGVETYVASPSFVIVNQHTGRLTLYHVDLYRAERLDPELEDTVADVIEAGGVTAIEWPRVLPDALRKDATVICFSRPREEARLIVLGTPHRRLAEATEGEPRTA